MAEINKQKQNEWSDWNKGMKNLWINKLNRLGLMKTNRKQFKNDIYQEINKNDTS